MLPHIQAGAARALVVAGTKRLPELPDVPTLVEAGLSGYPDEVWMGLVAPGGTPAPIVERLNGAINEALRSPEARAIFARSDSKRGRIGAGVCGTAGDLEKWAAVIS
jgi:tripartite-type tricarboxylate transporter receptor subunit TctC